MGTGWKSTKQIQKELIESDSDPNNYDSSVQPQVINQRVEAVRKAQSDTGHRC